MPFLQCDLAVAGADGVPVALVVDVDVCASYGVPQDSDAGRGTREVPQGSCAGQDAGQAPQMGGAFVILGPGVAF